VLPACALLMHMCAVHADNVTPWADAAMESVFGAEYVSLHVRVTNRVAFHLYTHTLKYE
jgi:hypothetical protein